MSRESKREDTTSDFERPKVHVTVYGRMYVKPDELLRSKRGREMVKKMAELESGANRSPASSAGN